MKYISTATSEPLVVFCLKRELKRNLKLRCIWIFDIKRKNRVYSDKLDMIVSSMSQNSGKCR